VLVFPLLLLMWQSTFQLAKLDVQGLSRFPPEAVMKTVGLKVGTQAGKAELDRACQKLIDTGLFEGCNWKYAGGAVTLELKEAPAGQTVHLSVPGVNEKQLWAWLADNEPLVQPKMPASDQAIQFYTKAVQRYLKQDMPSSVDSNLDTHETMIAFRPSNLPSIASVKFEGAQAIDAATLEKKITPAAQGTAFTEHDFRLLLDQHIRPLYEDLGRLKISFLEIREQRGVVTVLVEEGPVYKLGHITVTGVDSQPQLTAGDLANWRKVVEAFEAVGKGLRNQGYLEAKYKLTRELKEDGTVDVKADYTRGKQFVFGTLKLAGLSPTQESIVRPLWTLAPGAPMNEGYIDEFIKAAFGKLGPEFSGVGSQVEPGAGNVADVAITFRKS
jgi:outer membrane protein assembly factor BamA